MRHDTDTTTDSADQDRDQDKEHLDCWDMISWVINGTASQADAQRVLAHAQRCSECQEEMAFQREVAQAVASRDEVRGDVDAAWLRMQADLPQEPAQADPVHGPRSKTAPRAALGWWQRMRAGRNGAGLGLGLALQSVCLVLVTVLWLDARKDAQGGDGATREAPYATLSTPPAAPTAADIRVVLSPTLTLADVRKLVQDAGLRIVDINDEGTIFGLKAMGDGDVDEAAAAQLLTRLRSQTGVLLAEPVVHDGASRP